MNNLAHLGYGVKVFTISMIEAALHIAGDRISGLEIQQVVLLGKSLFQMPVKLLADIKKTL